MQRINGSLVAGCMAGITAGINQPVIVVNCCIMAGKTVCTAAAVQKTAGMAMAYHAVGIGIMILAVAGLALMSEFLVSSLDFVTETFGLSEFFVGIILVPLIGNVAEHLVAVQVAIKNQMDLSLSIALGSSLQITLLVAPLLVFISLFMGHPMTLEFNHPEVIAMVAASVIAALVAIDGRSNWFEGAMLLGVPLPFKRSVAGGADWEFFKPIKKGDIIHTVHEFSELQDKTSDKGPRALMVYKSTHKNQKGEVVAISTNTIMSY